jgi:hypothetical protein
MDGRHAGPIAIHRGTKLFCYGAAKCNRGSRGQRREEDGVLYEKKILGMARELLRLPPLNGRLEDRSQSTTIPRFGPTGFFRCPIEAMSKRDNFHPQNGKVEPCLAATNVQLGLPPLLL